MKNSVLPYWILLVLGILVATSSVSAIDEKDFYGTYKMVHDGKWEGILMLEHNPYFDNDINCNNIQGYYTAFWNNKTYQVTGRTLNTTRGGNSCGIPTVGINYTDGAGLSNGQRC